MIDADAISSEMEAGRFMDIVRYKAGTKTVEDGHIMAERNMSSGQGAEFEAKLKAKIEMAKKEHEKKLLDHMDDFISKKK